MSSEVPTTAQHEQAKSEPLSESQSQACPPISQVSSSQSTSTITQQLQSVRIDSRLAIELQESWSRPAFLVERSSPSNLKDSSFRSSFSESRSSLSSSYLQRKFSRPTLPKSFPFSRFSPSPSFPRFSRSFNLRSSSWSDDLFPRHWNFDAQRTFRSRPLYTMRKYGI